MFKKIPRKIIHYVERTQGMKFKKTPTLGTTREKRSFGKNIVDYSWKSRGKEKKITKVNSAKVLLAPKLLAHKNVYTRRVILLHELRENLQFQNRVTPSSTAHKQANKFKPQDLKYAQRGLLKRGLDEAS